MRCLVAAGGSLLLLCLPVSVNHLSGRFFCTAQAESGSTYVEVSGQPAQPREPAVSRAGEHGNDAEMPVQPGESLEAPFAALPACLVTGPRISLEDCLRRALDGNPELAALQKEIWAAQARSLQGSLKPNPELEAEISDFLGTAETRFFRGAVTGLGLSQLIERGNKRCARMTVAAEEGGLAQLELERARLDVMLAASRGYYEVLAAQERLQVAAQLEELAKQVRDVVALKVEAGKAARLELSRVELDLARAGIAREQAEQVLAGAVSALALLWAEDSPQFAAVEGQLLLPAAPPRQEELLLLLQDSPDIERWDQEERLRRARRDLAYAEGIPDYTLSGGLERFESTDSFGFRIGISLPLPLHDRNQGRVSEAQRYLEQAADQKAAELRRSDQALSAITQSMLRAYNHASALQSQVLPAAAETFELTGYGYRYGKFGLLDVLDAERTLVEARSEYVEALAEYYLAGVQLERLIAQPLGEDRLLQCSPGVSEPRPAGPGAASANDQEEGDDDA